MMMRTRMSVWTMRWKEWRIGLSLHEITPPQNGSELSSSSRTCVWERTRALRVTPVQPYSFGLVYMKLTCLQNFQTTAERPDSVSSPPVDTHTHTHTHSTVILLCLYLRQKKQRVTPSSLSLSTPIIMRPIVPLLNDHFHRTIGKGGEVGLGVVVVIIDVPYLRSYRSYTCTTYYYIVRKGVIRLWNSFWTRQASRRAALGRTRHTQRNS